MTPATIPPQTGPIIPTDTVNLLVRLGEIGTAWIDKQAYAIQDLKGFQSAVEFDLPLLGTTAPGVPVLFPSGSLPVDYEFLLDGRFGLAAGSTHFVASLYQVLESPQFELSEFVLELDGVAIPEPSTAAILFAAMACASFVHSAARHTDRPANVR